MSIDTTYSANTHRAYCDYPRLGAILPVVTEDEWWITVDEHRRTSGMAEVSSDFIDLAILKLSKAVLYGSTADQRSLVLDAQVLLSNAQGHVASQQQSLFNFRANPRHLLLLAIRSLISAGMATEDRSKAFFTREAEAWLRTWWVGVVMGLGHREDQDSQEVRGAAPAERPWA